MSLAYPLFRLPHRSSLAAAAALASSSPLPVSVILSASASADGGGELTAREKRLQRRERRELRATDWKEEVQDRLIHEPARRRKKPPKRLWREELNLDLLAELGPQWWLVRVSMAPGTDYVDLLTKATARRFPEVTFKIYNPSIQVKRRLKSGAVSVKSKPLHPGLVFLHCTLNKELHDFIRDTEGCYGFIGATVGSIKRQIKKPKPIPIEEVESIIGEEKEEQEKVDREFEQMEGMGNVESFSKPVEESELMLMNKIKKQFKKSPSKAGTSHRAFSPGATVHVLSGPFEDFTGSILEVNRKNKKATVQLTLFGKESFVDLDFDQIEMVEVNDNDNILCLCTTVPIAFINTKASMYPAGAWVNEAELQWLDSGLLKSDYQLDKQLALGRPSKLTRVTEMKVIDSVDAGFERSLPSLKSRSLTSLKSFFFFLISQVACISPKCRKQRSNFVRRVGYLFHVLYHHDSFVNNQS